MHALAHPIGAHRGAHHGLLNAIVMPYVLEMNRSAISQRIERLAAYMGLPEPSFDGFMSWLLSLRRDIGIPETLQAVGLTLEDCELFAPLAINDPSASTNPVPMTLEYTNTLLVRSIGG